MELYRVGTLHVNFETGSNVTAREGNRNIKRLQDRVKYQPAQTAREASGISTSARPIRAVRGIRPITFDLDTDAL
jgi:hypothetical protein